MIHDGFPIVPLADPLIMSWRESIPENAKACRISSHGVSFGMSTHFHCLLWSSEVICSTNAKLNVSSSTSLTT